MLGAIIVVTFVYYVLSFALDWGLAQLGLYIPWLETFVPMLVAGYFGGTQYVRTEMKTMGVGDRLGCAFKSCLAIALAPSAFFFAIFLVQILIAAPSMIPNMAGITASMIGFAALEALLFAVIGLPLIFAGLSIGLWVKQRDAVF